MNLEELKTGKVYRGISVHNYTQISNIVVQFLGQRSINAGNISYVWDTIRQRMDYRYYGEATMDYREIVEGSTTWKEYFSRILQYDLEHGSPVLNTQRIEHFPIY